jgi:hypothetical protein
MASAPDVLIRTHSGLAFQAEVEASQVRRNHLQTLNRPAQTDKIENAPPELSHPHPVLTPLAPNLSA